MRLHLDWETASEAELKDVGAALYIEHASTFPLVLSYALQDNPVVIMPATDGSLETDDAQFLYDCACDPSIIFVAHNAGFERKCWQKFMVEWYGWPELPLDRWDCTMAKAYAHSLPGSLEKAAIAMKLSVEKDMEKRKSMLTISKPKRGGECQFHGTQKRGTCCGNMRKVFWTYEEVPQLFEDTYVYNGEDVEVERALDKRLRDLSPKERRIWLIDQRINTTGIHLDLPLVRKAIDLVDSIGSESSATFQQYTGGLRPTQRAKILEFLQSAGLQIEDTQGTTLELALADPGLDSNIRTVLEIMSGSTKSSLAKYPEMIARSTETGIVRELLQYHGAHTGRWAGRGIQLQNFPRPVHDVNTVMDILEQDAYDGWFEMCYGSETPHALSSGLRGVIVPPPMHRWLVGDYSQMEARVLSWLAGFQEKLDMFASGKDPYCVSASDIYGYTVTEDMKTQRQTGKVGELALGFQGGIGAYVKMGKQYRIDLSKITPGILNSADGDELEEGNKGYILYTKRDPNPVAKEIAIAVDIIKQRWRAANGPIVQFWHALEAAVIKAIKTKQPVNCGKLRFFINDVFLYCRLPSGRFMAYPYPRLKEGSRGKCTIEYMQLIKNQWVYNSTYGGKIAENVVQGTQRDLLSDSHIRLEDAGYHVSFHAHDENITAMPEGVGSLEEYADLMKNGEPWTRGIPVQVKAWEGYRYDKD